MIPQHSHRSARNRQWLALALVFALIGTLALPAEAVKHCACRPRGLPTGEVAQ